MLCFVNAREPPCQQRRRPPPTLHDLAINHWQACGSCQPEIPPGGSAVAPHLASGCCDPLERVMDTLAQFQKDHNPPKNEEELVAYCRALGPVLATLQTAGTEDVGAVQNLNLFAKQTNKATFEQRDQQLSQATLLSRQALTSSGRLRWLTAPN